MFNQTHIIYTKAFMRIIIESTDINYSLVSKKFIHSV